MALPREGASAGPEREHEEGHPTARAVPTVHEPGLYERFGKPVFDRLFGITMTILTLPLVVALVVGIWMTLGRPAIYRQTRIRRFGREFTVYKLRTMRADRRINALPIEHDDRRLTHKSDDDPRHVPYGRFLRKWSLDEIPQFWNVALGQMSVVGPRPEIPSVVGHYADWQHRRHEVKPGLTGLWQITERGNVPMHEATHIDVEYVDHVTFWGDLKILVRTPAAILGSRTGN